MGTDHVPITFRLRPAVHDALRHWASNEDRSLNWSVNYLLTVAIEGAKDVPRDGEDVDEPDVLHGVVPSEEQR